MNQHEQPYRHQEENGQDMMNRLLAAQRQEIDECNYLLYNNPPEGHVISVDRNMSESSAMAAAISNSEWEAQQARALALVQANAEQEREQLAAAILESTALEAKQQLAADDEQLATALQSSEQEAEAQKVRQQLESSVMRQKGQRTEERNQGCWDCLKCTYMNRPYAAECAMCSSAAPPDVLTFKSISKLRFGLEIEIIVPDGKTDGYTLESIARDLTKLGPTVDYMGYCHETTCDWKLVTDSSLRPPNGADRDLCFELVSPVLTGEEGLGSLRAIMDSVRRLGVATNTSCGFHVHVDASSGSDQAVPEMGTLDGLKRVSQCFVALENAFDLLVALSWDTSSHSAADRRTNRNTFCRSNRLAFQEMSNRQTWYTLEYVESQQELVNAINPEGDRYRKLNLTNLTKPERPSTCEFRHHGGVEELQETEAWVRLILRFCENASQRTAASEACLLHEEATVKEELNALFDLVDCEGLQQFFVVERRLFKEDNLQNDYWECAICQQRFANSRLLSHHLTSTGHR